MPDFKGRKDFPEVADAKIKIGDYSGTNRLAVTDIYSPKSEPTLRDQMIEPVKGNKQNNYDSPILSQQPVIVLSDVEAEADIINAIDGYLGKQMPGVGMPSAETKPKAPTETKIPDVGGGWRGTSQAKPKAQAASPSAPAPKPYSAFDQAGGAGAPVKTTPGVGFDEGPGVGQRAAGAARGAAGLGVGAGKLGARGAAGAGKLGGKLGAGIARRVGGAISDVGQAAKVGVQQGIRSGREGAYEHGAEADARRAEQRGKVYKNPLTASAGWAARTAAKAPGVRGAAKALGFGRTKAQEEAMRTRMEYAGDDEMMLSDILNELESYVAEQSNTDVAERQLTKGNFSKMMRNTDDKPARGWKYHV